jgi:hypothetical protein
LRCESAAARWKASNQATGTDEQSADVPEGSGATPNGDRPSRSDPTRKGGINAMAKKTGGKKKGGKKR